MTKSEAVIRTILGPTRRSVTALACAVDQVIELLFVKKIPMSQIQVNQDVYPAVAEQLGQRPQSVARQVERIANCCWEMGDSASLARVIGRTLPEKQGPKEMLFYLAFYVHLDTPFYQVVEQSPELLF